MTNPTEWFEKERGIKPETLEQFGVKLGDDSAEFPYPGGNWKTRKGFGTERKFFFTPGMSPGLFHAEDLGKDTIFLCEGESDTMRLWQEIPPERRGTVGVVGLGGIQTWNPGFAAVLKTAKRVWVCLDNDEDYAVSAKVDETWRQIRHDVGARAKRLRLPAGAKDLCEFFGIYPFETLAKIAGATRSASRFKPLDLTRTPPPTKWLLEGLVAMGDLTLVSGASGLGKSWLTMGLAVAVADKHQTFMGLPIHTWGKVLIVDEENPEDVIYSRMNRLGLQNYGNVRYIWNNGVRLDREPEALLDEALEYEPTLVVLDAFTRLHTKEENQSGDMAGIFNDALKPLARETGASVLLIHHHDKSGTSPRGSSDITASPDGTLDVYRAGNGQFRVRLTKSRRRLTGEELTVRIADQPDGTVNLIPIAGVGLPDTLDDLM